jgi:lon-related putative ATP-dependent protease
MSRNSLLHQALPADLLYSPCDPAQFSFKSTAGLEPLDEFIGQSRAVESVQFAIGMDHDGYNLFAFGPQGTGKSSLVREFLRIKSADQAVPDDWCYIHNFSEPHKPRALRLPPGRGRLLAQDLDQLIEDLLAAIPAIYEGEEYQLRRQTLEDSFKEDQEISISELQEAGADRNVAIIRTPMGLAVAPMKNGEVLKPEVFQKLLKKEREEITSAMEEVQETLQETLAQVPKSEKEHREKIRDLGRRMTEVVVKHLIGDLKLKHNDLPHVISFLEEVRADIVRDARDFLPDEMTEPQGISALFKSDRGAVSPLRRFRVNVIVDNCHQTLPGEEQSETADQLDRQFSFGGAPIVEEDNPSQPHLIGRIEHLYQMGALVTDFTMIKPGALHAANGGYLVLDARKLLMLPFAWETLKMALNTKKIRYESPADAYGLASTITLDPEPIPLDVKVILLGEPDLYYLLTRYDPEFRKLFKVAADFETEMKRSTENDHYYARLIATMGRDESLRPLDAPAVARVVEFGARLTGDAERLTTHMGSINDIVREADYWAAKRNAKIVRQSDIQKAIDAKTHRSDRIRERLQEQIERDTIVINTSGEKVGEVNGLAIYQLDHFSFGKPSRISCRVHLGKGEVIDIEREVDLGGPLHTKGVLILSSYLSSKYAKDRPLALAANLVFEQSYGGIDGDSASSTELYALISAIAEFPLKQSIAVTGSVDQQGRIQAIGGVNEKIEGFFDICQVRGLTGDQGVMIPAANVKHLMLRHDVVEACDKGQFNVFAVETIDQGLEILTGEIAGDLDEKGEYPLGSINRAVSLRLATATKRAVQLVQQAQPRSINPAIGT